jgi:ADP-ribose pyrophosphatase YjhB (NUDIX family)
MFDDDHAVADAGLALVGVLSEKLGLEALAEELVYVHPFPGRRVATLVHAMVAGADCIDDADVLRSGSSVEVLAHKVMAPSTLGTFLRAFSFGHVRQLDKVSEAMLTRAWSLGAGPGSEPMTIDLDSTICPVHGHDKQGASFGYTKVLGYHPLLGTRSDTGEVLHVRFRKGSAGSGRGAERFIRELVGRVRRAGSTGPLTLRADSGFYSRHVIKACRDHKVSYSITARQNATVKRAIETIDEKAWVKIDYTDAGEAWAAETPYGDGHRLVVRRTKLADPQPALFPTFRYHAFITDRAGDAVELDADHRCHAVIELAIRDLKEGSGLSHCPSGCFGANGAWTVCATIAHNLIRWLGVLGLKISGPLVAKTVRRRFLSLPGRMTRRSRRRQLHLPTNWPWAKQWSMCFERLCVLKT